MPRHPYVLVDVFTQRALEGNALAVFTDAAGLSTAEMQAVARETNLSETTFVCAGGLSPGAPVPVRIFTVAEELPFAGHPTLGTAAVLRGASGAREVVLALAVGPVPVAFEDRASGVYGEMRQREPEAGRVHDRGEVARALGVAAADLDDALPVQTFSTGVPFAIVPLRSLAALRGVALDLRAAAAYLARSDAKAFYLVSRETVDPAARLHARMIFDGGEDPATGSAAGCCAAWMVAHGVARPDEQVLIEQGLEISRPSRLFVRAGLAGGRPRDVRVGGHVVEVGRGELRV
ncbi:MAG: PhzF family phenazine biosynthesis protein [Anaeromyxobacteraceae bacterium]